MPELWTPLSTTFQTTREHLHQLAFFAVSPARYKAVGRMGLKPTPAGFGTPSFDSTVARVEGELLVLEREESVATQQISDVRSAAEFLAGEYDVNWFPDFHDPLDPLDPDTPLQVVAADVHRVGAWFQYGFELLNDLRAKGTENDDASEAQIWPEHFDAAAELGDPDRGLRASFGASPGDAGSDEPYLYVAPWGEVDTADGYWNAEHFKGSILTFSKLLESEDQRAAGLGFYLEGYEALRS
jgi:hypothetical protein